MPPLSRSRAGGHRRCLRPACGCPVAQRFRSPRCACLQDQLLQLKQEVPGLCLSKSSGTPEAPFPIRAAAEVSAAPEAERYDVSGFRLAVQLHQGLLGLADPSGGGSGTGLAYALSVEVSSPELPAKLRQAIAAELKRLWAASNPGESVVHSHMLCRAYAAAFKPVHCSYRCMYHARTAAALAPVLVGPRC